MFALLSVGGGVTVLLSALISETYRAPEDASLAQTVGDMLCIAKSLVKEKGFTALACFIGVAGIPFFAFIAVASYIFIDYFEMSYLDYSLIYAATCVVNLVAPYVYLKMQKRFDTPTIMRICIVLTGVSFAVMAFVGDASPWGICVGFLPYALAEGIARPAAYLVLLEQPEENVGTASAFGNFAYGGITSFATVLATLNWPTFVFALVVLMGASAAGMLALYAAGHGGWTEAARR